MAQLTVPAPGRPLPHLVDGPTLRRAAEAGRSGALSRAERLLLDAVGRHPFLPLAQLATFLGAEPAWTRRCRNRLRAAGLLRLVGADEVGGEVAARELAELTVEGVECLAALLGLGLDAAVRYHGLVGGGPEQPIGSRTSLLAHLAHTHGADELFIELARLARERRLPDPRAGLVEWRNAAACADRAMRPDGYGVLRWHGRLHGFFVEYDRATMREEKYRRKFAAYHDCRERGCYGRAYDAFPTVLVVTTDEAAEERLARAARAAAFGRAPGLPVLLATTTLLKGQSAGLLGPIWRAPGSGERRRWPPAGPTRSSHPTDVAG